MAEYGRGIKAGAIAGIVYGILLAMLIGVVLPQIAGALGVIAAGLLFVFGFPFLLIFGIMAGLFFGIMYASFYERIPGGSSVIKGIVLALILAFVGIGMNSGSMSTWPVAGIAIYVVFDLIASLIWGALVGILWDKFGGPVPTT